MESLGGILKDRIARGGPLAVADYKGEAQGHPPPRY